MFESLGFENFTAPEVTVFFALGLGLAFGLLAERTGFCLRHSLVGEDRRAAAGVWLTALAVALIGTQAAVQADLISFADHRYLVADLPLAALVVGGLLFGAGMILTRGCASRLTVLSGTGNLRALLVMLVFAFVAHATLKGVLAPARVWLNSFTLPLESAALPGAPLLWTAALAITALAFALRSGNSAVKLAGAALLGLLVPIGWVGTGYVLYDDFDPVALESLAFTAPMADSLFFGIASSAVPANFGVGLIGGTVLGSLIAALLFRSFKWQSFETPAQTGRYLLGGALMGFGGVLAGGCTVGAGLSGIPTLSITALVAILSIIAGGLVASRLLNASASGSDAPSTTPAPQPAE